MNLAIPTDNEIRDAICEIFDHPLVQKSEYLYKYLVPEDPSISDLVGYPALGLLQYSTLKISSTGSKTMVRKNCLRS